MTSLYQRLQQSGNPVAALEVVTDLIEKGKTNSEIAHIMGISERWARTLNSPGRGLCCHLQVQASQISVYRHRYLDKNTDPELC